MKQTVFVRSLSIIMLLSNIIGMSHFSYKFENNYETSMILSDSVALRLVELSRFFVLLTFTYAVLQLPSFYLRYMQLIRFWTIIVLARLFNNRMVKYERINVHFRIRINNTRRGRTELFFFNMRIKIIILLLI